MGASFASYEIIRPGHRARVDDNNFQSVGIIVASNVYIGQGSADSDDADQIVLSHEGARALIDALEELL